MVIGTCCCCGAEIREGQTVTLKNYDGVVVATCCEEEK